MAVGMAGIKMLKNNQTEKEPPTCPFFASIEQKQMVWLTIDLDLMTESFNVV